MKNNKYQLLLDTDKLSFNYFNYDNKLSKFMRHSKYYAQLKSVFYANRPLDLRAFTVLVFNFVSKALNHEFIDNAGEVKYNNKGRYPFKLYKNYWLSSNKHLL